MSYYQLACSPACQPEPNKSQRMQRLLLYSLKCLSVWVCVWEKINVPNLKFEYLSNHWSDLPQILNLSLGDQAQIKNASNEDDLQWKTTLNGRWPQNIKSGISQQPLIGSSSNFKLKLRGQNKIKNAWYEDDLQWKTTSNGRRPPMEDDLQCNTTSNGRRPKKKFFKKPKWRRL